MKRIVNCQLIGLEKVNHVQYRAWLQRTGEHPVLGAERQGQTTVTSLVLRIDFENHLIETLNTIYRYD